MQLSMLSRTIWETATKPSKLIDDVMDGRIRLEDQTKSIQSACSFHIYQEACRILKLTEVEERRLELDKIPAELRLHIEKEVKKIWDLRKQLRPSGLWDLWV